MNCAFISKNKVNENLCSKSNTKNKGKEEKLKPSNNLAKKRDLNASARKDSNKIDLDAYTGPVLIKKPSIPQNVAGIY